MAPVTVIKFYILHFNYFQLFITENPSCMCMNIPMNMLKYCLHKTNHQGCIIYICI